MIIIFHNVSNPFCDLSNPFLMYKISGAYMYNVYTYTVLTCT